MGGGGGIPYLFLVWCRFKPQEINSSPSESLLNVFVMDFTV